MDLMNFKRWKLLVGATLIGLALTGIIGCKSAKKRYEEAVPYTGFGIWYLGSWVGINHFYSPAVKTEVIFQENGEVIWKSMPDPTESYQRVKEDQKHPVTVEALQTPRIGKIVDEGHWILFPDGAKRSFTKEPQERLRITIEDTFQGSILLIRKPSAFP
jgi:hypothetical protein